MKQRVVYLCSGDKPDCRKTDCKLLGRGQCEHTEDEQYARDQDHHFVSLDDGTLWEVEK